MSCNCYNQYAPCDPQCPNCGRTTTSSTTTTTTLCPDALKCEENKKDICVVHPGDVCYSIPKGKDLQQILYDLLSKFIPNCTTTTTTVRPTTTTTLPPTTTTTTCVCPSTTTSTSTSTTSTTTLPPCSCMTYSLKNITSTTQTYSYTNCSNVRFNNVNLAAGTTVLICVCSENLQYDKTKIIALAVGTGCNTSTTTSTSSTSTTSTSSSTTTTTAAPKCQQYRVQSTALPASWSAKTCYNVTVGGSFTTLGQSLYTGCIWSNTLVLTNASVKEIFPCPSPTSTTTSSTSTTTSTSTTSTTSTTSSTTTTTTIPPTTTTTTLNCECYTIYNSSATNTNTVSYVGCGGAIKTIFVSPLTTVNICVQYGSVPIIPSGVSSVRCYTACVADVGCSPCTTTTTSTSSTTTTTTTINPDCDSCSVPQFLPLPGNSVVVDGVTLDISSTKPGGLVEVNQYLVPACLPDQTYHLVGGGGVLYTNWDYTITFSQPVNNVTIRVINYSSSTRNDSFGTPPFPYIISQERVVFTTNTGVPTVGICNACNVEVSGNYLQPILYWNPAGGFGAVDGSGSFVISQSTPFTTLTLTPQQMGYDPNTFSSGLFFDICGLEVSGGTTTTTTSSSTSTTSSTTSTSSTSSTTSTTSSSTTTTTGQPTTSTTSSSSTSTTTTGDPTTSTTSSTSTSTSSSTSTTSSSSTTTSSSTSTTTSTTLEPPPTSSTTSSTTSTTSSTSSSTTTSSTTIPPSSTTTSSSTTSSTSTTTTEEPTTSTTTTELPPSCFCYTIENTTEVTLNYNYTICQGEEVAVTTLGPGLSISVCSSTYPTGDDGIIITGGTVSCTGNGDCTGTTTTSTSTSTTTTTTEAPPPPPTTTTTTICVDCREYLVTAESTAAIVQWINCDGTPEEITLEVSEAYPMCAVEGSIVIVSGTPSIVIGALCGNTCPTTTTTTSSGTTTTTTTECVSPCYNTEYNVVGTGTAEWFACNASSPTTQLVTGGTYSFCHDGSGVVFYGGASGTPTGNQSVCGCNEIPPTTTSTTTTSSTTTTTTISPE